MTIFVNREDIIATCERYIKSVFRQKMDEFLENLDEKFHIQEQRCGFLWLKKKNFRINDNIYYARYCCIFDEKYELENWIQRKVYGTKQSRAILEVYDRSKQLNSEWIPVTETEIEHIYDWWVPSTRFFVGNTEKTIDEVAGTV